MTATHHFTGKPLETLNREALAELSSADAPELELAYRSSPGSEGKGTTLLWGTAATATSAGAAVLLLAYMIRFFPAVQSLLLLAVGGGLMFLAVRGLIAGRSSQRTTLFLFTAALFAPGALSIVSEALATRLSRELLFLFALAVAALAADRIANHYAHWMLANPRLPSAAKTRWLATWKRRYLGVATPILAVAWLSYGVILDVDDPTAAALLLLAPPILTLALAALMSLSQPIRHLPALFRDALISFLAYGTLGGDDAPATFQSPSGSHTRRHAMLSLVIGLLAFATPLVALKPLLDTEVLSLFPSTLDEVQATLAYLPLLSFALLASAYSFPALVLSTFFFAGSARALLAIHTACEAPDAPDQVRPQQATLWECLTTRLQTSSNALEREHLLVGAHRDDDYPLLVHRHILSEHAYIFGDSGSGKTSLGLLPMLTQLLRLGDAGMVVIDLKGDSALFETVRAEAGDRFRFFTNELGRSSHIFNPFQQRSLKQLTHNQLCEVMLESLNLNHGEGYGRSYYTRVSRQALSEVLRDHPDAGSFQELFDALFQHLRTVETEKRRDALELLAVIQSLSTIEALNAKPGDEGIDEALTDASIFMPDVIAENQVAYFWLPSAIESATVREVAKLAIYALLTSALVHQREHKDPAERRQTYLVIDEFQRIASDNFRIFLEQARSMGIGVLLSNQTIADLVTPTTDLRKTVLTNTRFKQCFSAIDLEQQDYLTTASGELVRQNRSESETVNPQGAVSQGLSLTDTIRPRLDRNAIISVSDDPRGSVVHISRGSGLSQYGGFSLPCRSEWSLSQAEYQRRSLAPWPDKSEQTLMVSKPVTEPEVILSEAARLRAAGIIPDGPEYADTDPGPGERPDGPLRERLDAFDASKTVGSQQEGQGE